MYTQHSRAQHNISQPEHTHEYTMTITMHKLYKSFASLTQYCYGYGNPNILYIYDYRI